MGPGYQEQVARAYRRRLRYERRRAFISFLADHAEALFLFSVAATLTAYFAVLVYRGAI